MPSFAVEAAPARVQRPPCPLTWGCTSHQPHPPPLLPQCPPPQELELCKAELQRGLGLAALVQACGVAAGSKKGVKDDFRHEVRRLGGAGSAAVPAPDRAATGACSQGAHDAAQARAGPRATRLPLLFDPGGCCTVAWPRLQVVVRVEGRSQGLAALSEAVAADINAAAAPRVAPLLGDCNSQAGGMGAAAAAHHLLSATQVR